MACSLLRLVVLCTTILMASACGGGGNGGVGSGNNEPEDSVLRFDIQVSRAPLAGGVAVGGGQYDEGQQVNLMASPSTGYAFVNWTEGDAEIATTSSYSFPATGDRALVANFRILTYTILVNTGPVDGGSAEGVGDYEHGTNVTLTASPNPGYTFTNWTVNGIVRSSSNPYTFVADRNLEISANFHLLPVDISPNTKTVSGYSSHPDDSRIVFASTIPDFIGDPSDEVGNFISIDAGETWERLTDGWFAEQISYSPHEPSILIADPYISEDTGHTWRKTTQVPAAFDPTDLSIFFDPNRSDVIYGVVFTVLANPKLYQSGSLGLTWSPMSFTEDMIYLNRHEEVTIGGLFQPSIYTSTLSSDLVGVIYDDKILITSDGDSLTSSEFGLPLNYVARAIHFDESDPNVVRILLSNNVIYESVDAGFTWVSSDFESGNVPSGLSIYSWENNLSLSKYMVQDGRLYSLPE